MVEEKKNVILVMSGGTGSRFGADCPKQYCLMDGRMVIDYVIDACRDTPSCDEVVIVAADEYVDFVKERYRLPVAVGGETRPESVASGLRFVNEHYACQKIIITNAVCPLATSEQYRRYFDFLNEYDYVLTTWKLAPALHRFDGKRVDRDDFFNVMEPDAYRFDLIYDNFDFDHPNKYIFHCMPPDAKAHYCFDYPHTMKLTHSFDMSLLHVLYREFVTAPTEVRTLQRVNSHLSADGTQGVTEWIGDVQRWFAEIAQRYSVTSYRINSQTEANIVYEAQSSIYGDIVIKFNPSFYYFNKERKFYLCHSDDEEGFMAELVGADEGYHALVTKMVKPGLQVKFDVGSRELREFYDKVDALMKPVDGIDVRGVPTVMEEFQKYVDSASRYTYEREARARLEEAARTVWDRYFKESETYLLHRDLHRRNILSSGRGLVAIDPRGCIGPRAFEYVIAFIIELREYEHFNEGLFSDMFLYFSKYVDPQELLAALFIFWVYKYNDYVFHKKDGFRLASWCRECIEKVFYPADPEHLGEVPLCLREVRD